MMVQWATASSLLLAASAVIRQLPFVVLVRAARINEFLRHIVQVDLAARWQTARAIL